MTQTVKPVQPGPLKWPTSPVRLEARRAITERLHGHTTAAEWIPEDLSDELDALREEHARIRAHATAQLQALAELDATFKLEDRDHQHALREAARLGEDAPKDRRTPASERAEQRDTVMERIEAAAIVFAELADTIMATIAEQEPQLLGTLKREVTAAEDAYREAQRLLAEADKTLWWAHRRGQWVLATAEGAPLFGRQVAPVRGERMPHGFNKTLLKTSLERPWHRMPGAQAVDSPEGRAEIVRQGEAQRQRSAS